MSGDGVFYVIVADAIGRQSRFDLGSQNWTIDYVEARNRWWYADSDESLSPVPMSGLPM